MTHFFRSHMVRALSWYFNTVPVPPSLRPVIENPEQYLLVTQSDSLIIHGLLLSLAKRSGLRSAVHLSEKDARDTQTLTWTSLHRTQELADFLSGRPDVKLCSVNIFKVRGPLRHSPQNRLSTASLLGLLLARRLAFVLIGSPLSPPALSSSRLLRTLRVDFYRNLKLVRGTPFQPVDVQLQSILQGSEFDAELKLLAERAGLTQFEMREKARAAFLDLAANPRRPMYGILAIVAGFIVRRLFSEVITSGLDRLMPAIKAHTVVLVPMHRSHLDYILVGYKLYEANVNPPLVAAGMNLAFWPAGFILRSVGAYFVKRSARDRLHTLILRRYVSYLIKRGHLQEFFIEGGRSRSGKMLQPKLGLLSIILEAWRRRLRREILFVPVAISYENVIEDTVFGEENTGKSKQRETFFGLLRAMDIFRRKYGEVIINFGSPISLSEFAAHQLPNGNSKKPRGDEKLFAERLGVNLVWAIRDQISPTLTSLAATALMMSPGYGLLFAELAREVRRLAKFAELLRTSSPHLGEFSPTLRHFMAGHDFLLREIVTGGIIRSRSLGENEVFFVPGQRRFTADFYRNSVVHLFFPVALLSLLGLLDGTAEDENLRQLHELFAHEYILPSFEQFHAEMESLREFLIRNELMVVKGRRKELMPEAVMPELILSSIEALMWVEKNLLETRSVASAPESARPCIRAMAQADLLQNLKSTFKAAAYVGLVSRTEASSQSAIDSAFESLESRNLVSLMDASQQRKLVLLHSDLSSELMFLRKLQQLIVTHQRAKYSAFAGI